MRNRLAYCSSVPIGLHISIGSVYAWSVLLMTYHGRYGLYLMSQTTWTFSLAILMLGLSAGFCDPLQKNRPQEKGTFIAMLFWVAGLLGTAYALSIHNLTFTLSLLWNHRWYRTRYWLYNTSFYTGKILSKSPRICHRISHYGF